MICFLVCKKNQKTDQKQSFCLTTSYQTYIMKKRVFTMENFFHKDFP